MSEDGDPLLQSDTVPGDEEIRGTEGQEGDSNLDNDASSVTTNNENSNEPQRGSGNASDVDAQGEARESQTGQSQQEPIRLTGQLEDQYASNGVLRYSIVDAFEHIDPNVVLKLIAGLENGEALPDFVIFDEDTREFIIDADEAISLGVAEVTVKVIAVDDLGNQASSIFVIKFGETQKDGQAEAQSAVEDASALLIHSLESLPLRSEYEADFQQMIDSMTGSRDPEEQQKDFGKESLNEQVLRAGEFGYQQEKLNLTKLLEKLFS